MRGIREWTSGWRIESYVSGDDEARPATDLEPGSHMAEKRKQSESGASVPVREAALWYAKVRYRFTYSGNLMSAVCM